ADIKAIKDKSKLEQESRAAFEKFQQDRLGIVETVASLEQEIKEIEEVVRPKLAQEQTRRLDKFLDFFSLLGEEKAALEKLYEPLRAALLAGTETDQKLAFIAKFAFDASQFARRGLDILDRTRKGKY